MVACVFTGFTEVQEEWIQIDVGTETCFLSSVSNSYSFSKFSCFLCLPLSTAAASAESVNATSITLCICKQTIIQVRMLAPLQAHYCRYQRQKVSMGTCKLMCSMKSECPLQTYQFWSPLAQPSLCRSLFCEPNMSKGWEVKRE